MVHEHIGAVGSAPYDYCFADGVINESSLVSRDWGPMNAGLRGLDAAVDHLLAKLFFANFPHLPNIPHLPQLSDANNLDEEEYWCEQVKILYVEDFNGLPDSPSKRLEGIYVQCARPNSIPPRYVDTKMHKNIRAEELRQLKSPLDRWWNKVSNQSITVF